VFVLVLRMRHGFVLAPVTGLRLAHGDEHGQDDGQDTITTMQLPARWGTRPTQRTTDPRRSTTTARAGTRMSTMG